MKVTIEIPDNTLVFTYQYVYDDAESLNLQIRQNVLDSKALREMKEAAKSEEGKKTNP